MNEITLNIDCYQCGTKLEVLFRFFSGHTEYACCPDCQEEIQVHFAAGMLHIDRLGERY